MNPTTPALAEEPLTFKVATEHAELEQVYRLNYRTFVDEIPQHAPNGEGALVDKFDRENTYFICRRGSRVVGMLAMRTTRPFSLDGKVEHLDSYLPSGRRVCEIRLLAVEPEHRTGVVFRGLIQALSDHGIQAGYDMAVISGTVRQMRLYKHMGFVPFGPIVGSADAPFQPMYLTREAFESHARPVLKEPPAPAKPAAPAVTSAPLPPRESVSFLPGPVAIHPTVWTAFTRPPVSHRHPDFASDLSETQRMLCALVGAAHVQLLVGSGTLANDAIAAQLTLLDAPGLVLSNGEFGERLIDHVARAKLSHVAIREPWGALFDAGAVERALDALPPGGWCWMVHCETSSGVLNDLKRIRAACDARSLRLAVDCVSSIGTVPVDLHGVSYASCVSGKALGGLPGLSMVFHDRPISASPRLARYLDLGFYAECGGVPFTHSSNLLAALRVATERTLMRSPFGELRDLARWLRARLREMGFAIIAPEEHASPGVVTLAIPGGGQGTALGDRLSEAGFELSYRSGYLRTRDWVQIALMSDVSETALSRLLDAMRGEAVRPSS